MGLILSASILGVIYFLKICFPSFVIEVAQIDSITRIGHYIDTHKWAWYVASFALSFFVCYFTFCACCKKKRLTLKETIITISCIIFLYIIREFLPNHYNTLNYCIMILLPLLFKGDFKATTICFVSTSYLQVLSTEIRGISTLISNYNYATFIILCIDVYILIWLQYCYFNFEKEK
jgi:hypothetical protein